MLFTLGLSLALSSAPGGAGNLHPTFSTKVEQLISRSAAAGVHLVPISGYRKMDLARARQGRASWHNFGLAIDLNLRGRRSMRDALAHYDEDAQRWRTVARIGGELGLIWGGDWERDEIFHFEWHPGAPSALRKDTLDRLLADAGPEGKHFKRTWPRFGGTKPAVAKRPKPAKRPAKRPTQIAKASKRVAKPKLRARKASKTVRRRKRR